MAVKADKVAKVENCIVDVEEKKSLGPAAALYIWRRQRSSLNRSGSPFPEVQTHGCLCGPGLETSNIIACRGTLSEMGDGMDGADLVFLAIW